MSVTTAPSGVEGEGFPVYRAFAGVTVAAIDPFVHMDQMGEVDYASGEPKGTPWHTYRGFETVTYITRQRFTTTCRSERLPADKLESEIRGSLLGNISQHDLLDAALAACLVAHFATLVVSKHPLAAMRWSLSVQVPLERSGFGQTSRCFFHRSDIGVPYTGRST